MLRTAICWNSCIKLLSGCMTQYNATLAVELCNRLTPESFTGACISLEDYVAPQPKTVAVVAPCRYNTCRTDQVCVVDHRSSNGYSCLPGKSNPDRKRLDLISFCKMLRFCRMSIRRSIEIASLSKIVGPTPYTIDFLLLQQL